MDFGPALFWILDAFTFLAAPIVLLLAANWAWRVNIKDLGLSVRSERVGSLLLRCALATYVLWLLIYTSYIAGSAVAHTVPAVLPAKFSYLELLPSPGPSRAFAIAYLALTAALSQELIFRGFAWSIVYNVATSHQLGWYLAISSLGFASWHWDKGLPVVTSAAVFGAAAGVYFYQKRQLIPLLAAHLSIDWYWLAS